MFKDQILTELIQEYSTQHGLSLQHLPQL